VNVSWASTPTGASGNASSTPSQQLKNVINNVGGVCTCVRPEVGYFDVKFADSVQGWRRKWLYIKDESSDAQEYGLAPFNVAEDI
jgi:hypothetical protein